MNKKKKENTSSPEALDVYGKKISEGAIVVFSCGGTLAKGLVNTIRFINLSPPSERRDYFYFTRAELLVSPIDQELNFIQNRTASIRDSSSCVLVAEP